MPTMIKLTTHQRVAALVLATAATIIVCMFYTSNMSYEESITTPGQNLISTLGGEVQVDEGRGRVVIIEDNKTLMHFGLDNQGERSIKVAKEGYDSLTATNDQLIFNSNQNTFKVAATGVIQIPAVSSGIPGTPNVVTTSVNTGVLSATPLIGQAYIDIAGERLSIPWHNFDDSGIANILIDSSTQVVSGEVWLYISVKAYASGILDSPVRWYILQETAA